MVHPLYYVSQIFFFVWGALLCGSFFYQLKLDHSLKGADFTPRRLYLILLCVSSIIFVIGHFDPRGFLNIYPPPVMKLIELFAITCLLQSVGAALHLYLVAMFRQRSMRVPKPLRWIWFGISGVFFGCEVLSILLMATLDNYFFSGINSLCLAVQEIMILVVLHISLCLLSRGLSEGAGLNEEAGHSFGKALRKIFILRAVSFFLVFLAVLYQLAAPGGGIERLTEWGEAIPQYPSDKFSVASLASPALVCVCHSLCLFASRRSTTNSNQTKSNSHENRPLSSRMSQRARDSTVSLSAPTSEHVEVDDSKPKFSKTDSSATA